MKKLLLLFVVVFALTACEKTSDTTGEVVKQADKAYSYLMMFVEEEQGIDSYQTRVIMNNDFMRFDDGEGSTRYILYDRKNNIVYSIDDEDKTSMVVNPMEFDIEPPVELNYETRKIAELADAPKINGETPVHYQYLVNNDVCVNVITVKKLMPEAVEGMKALRLLRASNTAAGFNNIPADLHVPCNDALDTFNPAMSLQNGFPVHEWREGKSRTLVDFETDYQLPEKIFVIPTDYFTYSVQQLREGKVDLANRKVVE
jgi:hypothetical protein